MKLGLIFAISACFVWGAIFVIPLFLADFSSMELVIGRYLMYGFLSCVLFFRKGFSKVKLIPLKSWVMASLFALFANIIYYLGIVAGVRFASPPLTVLLIGLAPILIAIYGNWHVREISYKSLVLPCVGILFGLVLVNVTEIDWSFSTRSLQQYLLGLFGILVGLISWSWYAVHNARFLKRHPHIPSTDWATAIGVWTLVWAILIGILFTFILEIEVDLSKFAHWSLATLRYLVGIFILGVICSWFGCYLWNRASVYLPVSLMGPFLIFESLFGLLFVYSVNSRLPSLIELIGVLMMMGSTLLCVYVFKKQKFVS